MMNIKLIAVGKLKEDYLKDCVKEYQKRLSRYCSLEIIEVEDSKISQNSSPKEDEKVLVSEGERVLKRIKDDDYVIILDVHGKEIDSVEFAKKMENISLQTSSVTFVIGGSLGLSDDLRKRGNFLLKLSPMTFTHQMCRIIILEQVYRAFKINNNETYHK